jgi:integrase
MALSTAAQVGAVLVAADEAFHPIVALCAFAGLRLGEAAGLRVGEAAGLRVEDIDFLRRTLTAARQVQRAPGGAVEIRPPKYGSERVAAHRPDGGRSFTGEAGHPPRQNTVGYRWRTATAAAGVPGLRLHDLRHFYVSGLIASGCDVVTVQRALGHASATTTLNTYSHLWPTAEDRTRAAAQTLLAESCGSDVDWQGPTGR